MNTDNSDIEALINDPSASFRSFDDSTLASFISVWETRLREATNIHRRSDLRDRAQHILDFISNVPSSDLRLYTDVARMQAFLYRVSTKDFLIITGEA